MLHYLAIDTGGSKTNFLVFDSENKKTELITTIGFGLATDTEDEITVLRESLEKIKSKYEISAIAVNLGGKNKNQIKRIISECMPGVPLGIYRESEGYASAAFGRKYGADIILLAGTGTIATGIDESGNFVISGGWGMNISDGGSGYCIGLEAIKNSLNSLDSTLPLSPMQKEITGRDFPIEKTSEPENICTERDEVRFRIYPLDRRNIASYARIVAKHCDTGDENALEIMNNAGEELAKIICNCADKLLPHKAVKVAVSGGLCNSSKFWKKSFEATISKKLNIDDFIYCDDGIMQGTMELAMKLKENDN